MDKEILAVIVEDEPSAVETLQGMLNTFCPHVKVCARAASVEDALIAIREYKPQLVFLDIELPPMGIGFDLLKMSPNRKFGVIFTTAYPQYAIQAINEAQPWGYLVKPYRVADLVQRIQVAQQKILEENQDKSSLSPEQGLIIPDLRKGNIVVLAKDIIYCEADGGITHLYVQRPEAIEKISTTTRSLKDLAERLPSKDFCRTHHKYLVNLHYVVRYQRTGRNGLIYLSNQIKINISVQKMEHFEKQFQERLSGDI